MQSHVCGVRWPTISKKGRETALRTVNHSGTMEASPLLHVEGAAQEPYPKANAGATVVLHPKWAAGAGIETGLEIEIRF